MPRIDCHLDIPEARSDGQLKYDDSRWGYGANLGIPVADYGIPVPYKFTCKIHKVTIDVQEMKMPTRRTRKRAAPWRPTRRRYRTESSARFGEGRA